MTATRGWAVLACVLAAGLVGISGAAAGPADGTSTDEPLSTDNIVVEISVHENGSAVWTIEYRYRLTNGAQRSAFDDLRTEIAAERDQYVASLRTNVSTAVDAASERTDREMALTNVSVGTSRQPLPRSVGVVTHQFVWDGFAATNQTHIAAGDALQGYYVGPDQVLVVRWPEEYDVGRLEPEPTSRERGEATWRSGESFDEPSIVLTRRGGGNLRSLLGVVGVVVLVLGAGAVAYTRFEWPRGQRTTSDGLVATGADAAQPPDGQHPDGQPPNDQPPSGHLPDSQQSDGQQPHGRSQAPATDLNAGPQTDRSDEHGATVGAGVGTETPLPLSDEERVLRVLEAHGGRVKQQTVASSCDWSDSKTSRVVQSLDEAGHIDRFKLGRENVLTLPEVTLDE